MAKREDGILIQGAFSFAGNSGGGGIEGSAVAEGFFLKRLHEKNIRKLV